ncbi:MAG TPA: Amuc_1100 family pilus-like protein [Chthoniobacterales bacterium]|jgi:hypothetical protein
MNWFAQNKFLGSYLAALALATILALVFLLHEKSGADDEQTRLDTMVAELTRLRSGSPFPNGANLRKMRAQTASYRDSLGKLKEELKARTLPAPALEPDEFQAQLRQAVNAIDEQAAAAKVKLPANFYLGFEEYATSLPNAVAAPLLGRELKAVAMLVGSMIDAHIDSLESLVLAPLPEEKPTPAPTPGRTLRGATNTGPAIVRADGIEITFAAAPAAARKILNQIATASEQLFIIRTLVVKNPADKGPKRAGPADTTATAVTTTTPPAHPNGANPAASPTVSFIVGTEHITVAAKVDIVCLNPDEKETR